MSTAIHPIAINNFPYETNCFGFALGLTQKVSKSQEIYNLNHKLPIAEAFLEKVKELGLEAPRQIQSLEDAKPDDFVLKVYDFTRSEVRHPYLSDFTMTFWNFHVLRRELDGTWVHKPGWDEKPCEVDDWQTLEKEFGCKYVLFAF